MNKKTIGLMLIPMILILISNVVADNWIIEGNTVYTDNETWGELCMNPHTLHGPGYAYCNATMVEDYGNIDFVWGFNTSLERPRSIDLYNPHWDNTSSTRFFQNVSNIVVCDDVCEIGHDYNDIKRNVTYERCSEWNETTMECETYEQVTHTVCFDSYEQDGNNYTVTWHNARMKYWTDKTHLIESINYNWNGMNKWYYIKDISMPADITKTVRIWIDMPVTLGAGEDTKFFFAAKRTTDTIPEAIAADRFMALDPWHNASRSHRKTVNVTHVNATGSNLVNYTVFLNISKETEMQADFDDILFYETDGTAMSFEYENHTTDYGLFWVLVSSLTSASDTQFWMYYGNDAATSSSNPESSWNVNCSMVQHLQEAPANNIAGHLDSTNNDNDGTPKNFDGTSTSTTDGTGIVDGADVFDGTDDYVLIPDSSSLDGFAAFTISAWIYPIDAGDNYRTIITKWSNYFFQFTNSETITTYIYGLNNPGWHSTTTLIEYNKWQHICLVYDGAHIRFYIDAVQDSNVVAATGTVSVTANDLTIGGTSDLSRMTNGQIDQVHIYNRALSADEINQSYQLVENQTTFVTWGSAEQQSEDPILHIDNGINVKEDWGRDFNSNLSANATVANASGVWMNFSNAEFTNTSLGWVNLTLDEWVNESHNVNTPNSNISVSVYLNSTASGATNDTESFYYNITNRTNTIGMDSSATQDVDTSETFYVNATCSEEYSDTFYGGANLLEDGAIIDTDTSVTDYVNFSHSESTAGQYNYTIRFYNLTHYDNATTPTYSNVTVSAGEYIPPDANNSQNTTGNFWVNHTWTSGLGEPTENQTDSFNVSINLVWHNTTIVKYYNNSGLSAHDWSNISIWAYNNSGDGSLSNGYDFQDVQIPNNVPVLSGLPDNTTDEDINRTDIFDLDDYFTDADSDNPTYLVESNNQSSNVSVTINASNNVSYTLASGWNGTAEVVINVTDGWGGEDNDTFLIFVNAPSPPGDYIPPNPTNLANTTGNGWVNYTWDAGTPGNVTNSYNVSWNSTWYNITLVTFMNDTVGEFGWANISVWAYNSSGNGSLSTGNVTDNTRAGGGTFITNMNTGVWNLISYYNSTNGTAETFGIDIGNVDYVAKYNGSFYTHTMGMSLNNFTTVHGVSYFIFLNASGSSTYTRNTISDSPYDTPIYNRWNTIGWTNATSTDAAGLITSINSTECKYICNLNADGITNTVYSKGFVTNNYAINRGYGYWAWNSNDTSWSRNN